MRLVISSVTKRFSNGTVALDALDLDVGPGVLGLLGPNGAGKSTLMRLLATITRPTSGTITWDGRDIARDPDPLRAVLGYLPQDFGVYPNLSAAEFLAYLAAAKGLEPAAARRRIAGLLELVNLADAGSRRLGTFSGGMRQRVGIAQALLSDPRLLIVDEPTAGLDPEERVRFRNLLGELAGDRIVVLSTHIVSDIEAAATRIAVLRRGRLLADTSPEALLRALHGKVWEWVVPSDRLPEVQQQHLVAGTLRREDGVHARVLADAPPVAGAAPLPATLEDAYIYELAQAGAGERP
jgi:ABC-type multidrug transport system ATPase subunit